jgi:glucose/arabinose dehydrogenase
MRALLPAAAAAAAFLFAASSPAQTPLKLQLVASGFHRPVLVTAPPGDSQRLFVVEQSGRIKIIQNGVVLPTPFLDLTNTGVFGFGGEMGLLGLAFHPQFASNRQFFVFHNTFPFPSSTVRRFTVSAQDPNVADLASAVTMLSTPLVNGNHNGGMLAFGPDQKLWIGIGDGGSAIPQSPLDPPNHAQRGDTMLGKMLRIDVDNPQQPLPYGIPTDNPFVGPGDPLDEIWSLGLRNPWRFSFDRATGDLWIADVGGLREEVDFEPVGTAGGRNYGWSCMQGTVCVQNVDCACNSPALTLPIFEYTYPWNRSIIGGYVYRGAAIPDLQGTYFFGDYNTLQIWSIRQQNGVATQLRERTIELQPPLPNTWAGITAFGEDATGELYVCDFAGDVYKIVANPSTLPGLAPFGTGTPGCNGPHALSASSQPQQGNAAFALQCSAGVPSGYGLMAIASLPDIAGSDPFALGLTLHFRLDSPYLSLQLMPSDAQGAGTYALPIPADPVLVAQSICAQAGWIWNPPCANPIAGWSSSNGLWITILP